MREIRGDARTVKELLKGRKYSIDYYQREYKWGRKQIQELIFSQFQVKLIDQYSYILF